MKRKLLWTVPLVIFSATLWAVEVPDGGWSPDDVNLIGVRSYWSFTIFKIDDVSSCGQSSDGDWELPTTKNNPVYDKALDFKKSILLAAFVAGKPVRLRCEGGELTDIIVSN